MTKADDLAFPVAEHGSVASDAAGLSKREYFAAIILQGLVSKYTMNNPEDQFTISKMSCELADEFIKHLNA